MFFYHLFLLFGACRTVVIVREHGRRGSSKFYFVGIVIWGVGFLGLLLLEFFLVVRFFVGVFSALISSIARGILCASGLVCVVFFHLLHLVGDVVQL